MNPVVRLLNRFYWLTMWQLIVPPAGGALTGLSAPLMNQNVSAAEQYSALTTYDSSAATFIIGCWSWSESEDSGLSRDAAAASKCCRKTLHSVSCMYWSVHLELRVMISWFSTDTWRQRVVRLVWWENEGGNWMFTSLITWLCLHNPGSFEERRTWSSLCFTNDQSD